jgi:CHAD domain-containing protein
MRQQLIKLTEHIDDSASSLTRRYSAKKVHTLRKTIRRIRSMLKEGGRQRARYFRKSWRRFAQATNDARDWDVFQKTARKLLGDDEFAQFKRLNRKRIATARNMVRTLLASEEWRRHLREWKKYLKQTKQAAVTSHRGREINDRLIEHFLAESGTALQQALSAEDDQSWHKFRIAVKNLRYVADAAASRPANTRKLIAICKALQESLGNWHDTVVQMQLLKSLEEEPVHTRLRSLISRNKNEYLSQTRAALGTQTVISAPDRKEPA